MRLTPQNTPSYIANTEPIEAPKVLPLPELPRGLRASILDLMSRGVNRVTEIAFQTKRDKPRTHKELMVLMKLGLVERVPQHYRLTERAMEILHDSGGLWPDEVDRVPYGFKKSLPKSNHQARLEIESSSAL